MVKVTFKRSICLPPRYFKDCTYCIIPPDRVKSAQTASYLGPILIATDFVVLNLTSRSAENTSHKSSIFCITVDDDGKIILTWQKLIFWTLRVITFKCLRLLRFSKSKTRRFVVIVLRCMYRVFWNPVHRCVLFTGAFTVTEASRRSRSSTQSSSQPSARTLFRTRVSGSVLSGTTSTGPYHQVSHTSHSLLRLIIMIITSNKT